MVETRCLQNKRPLTKITGLPAHEADVEYIDGMNPRIWASLDDFLHPSHKAPRLGRSMANYYFISALLRYASFDEYHFFLSNEAHCRLFLTAHSALFEEIGIRDRIKVFERLDLPCELRRNDYVVFHQSDHINYFSALCRLRNRFGNGFPVTAFIHSISYQEYMPKYLEMALAGAESCDALLCSSKCGKTVLGSVFSRLAEDFGKQLSVQMPVVPLGIDERDNLPKKADARQKLQFEHDEVIALCFGRFSELDKMDLFPLLQAFYRVASRKQKTKLVLAGSVHSANYLKMLNVWIKMLGLGDLVRVITEPDDDKKAELFAAADFFVSLSDNPQETFGLTLLEAMHAGLPLIVSDFDGYREIVSFDVGFRIPSTWSPMSELDELQPVMDERTFHLLAAQSIVVDIDRTADALHQLFVDADLRRRMGAASKLRFEACYSHKGIIEKLEIMWNGLKDSYLQEQAPAQDVMSLNMYSTFAHYVSEELSMEMKVVQTAFGRELLARKLSYPLLPNMAKLIDNLLVLDILIAVAEETSIQELYLRFQVPNWRFRYTILWMLKHELIRQYLPHCSHI
jgi:glycosyltransferase involved in cell wall biosynthesis